MTEKITLARPYAKAGFMFAFEHKSIDDWSVLLNKIAGIVNESTVKKIINNPEYTKKKKAEFIYGFVTDNPYFSNFLNILAIYNRLELLPEIAEVFNDLKLKHNKEVNILVRVAMPANETQQKEIKQLLMKMNPDLKVNAEFKVDESLIGGLVIHNGDKLIDASVKGKIRKLAEALIN